MLHYNVTTVLSLGCQFFDNVAAWLASGWNSSFRRAHYLSNVRTWAISFLCHLANMSSMVPFWASTGSGFVPNLGPASEARVRRRLFIVLMTAAHISPNVFSLRNSLSNIHVLFLKIHSTSSIRIMHHIHTNNYLMTFCSFISSDLYGRPAALSL
jgi:hypothetical protein